jgi:Flp pilus assembly protein TadG
MKLFASKQSGQSLVELAVIVTLLLTLLVGVVDFGLSYYTLVRIRNAVAEGGYYASQHPRDAAGVRSRIKQELRQLNPSILDGDIDIACDDTLMDQEQTTVTVDYQHPLLFNYVVSGSSVNLHAETIVPQLGGC